MAIFPALIPSSRAYTPGEYPHTPFAGINGKQNRVRHSNVMLSSQLRLGFIGLSEAEMLSILSHYQGQLGTFTSFTLPSAVWSGVSSAADYQLTNYNWRYIEPPIVEDLMCGGHNVELVLETVPPEGIIAAGMARFVLLTIAGGIAAAANGLDLAVSASLDAGLAGPPGLDETLTVSIDAGVASVEASGLDEVVAISVVSGNAAAANGIDETVAASIAAGTASTVDPVAALNPILWYDFSDESTITLSGSTITQIDGKGSRAWNLTKSSTGPTQATWTNNSLKCCDWGSAGHGNYLRTTDTTSTAIAEIYVVLDANYGSTFPDFNGLLGGTADPGVDLTGWSGQTSLYTLGSFNRAYINGSTTNSAANVLPSINSPSLLRVNRSAGNSVSTANGFQIGRDRDYNTRGWGGLIAEVIVFSSQLSESDRNTLQSHLADKWGITLV